jgi:hypothetical protein
MRQVCNANINVGAAKALSRKGELLAVPTQLINGDTVQIYIRKQDLERYREAANCTAGKKSDWENEAQAPVIVNKEITYVVDDKVDATEYSKELLEKLGDTDWNKIYEEANKVSKV